MSEFVKFKKKGRWAEVNPAHPQFDVEADEVKEVSDALAKLVVKAKAGTIVDAPVQEKADNRGKADKAAADKTDKK